MYTTLNYSPNFDLKKRKVKDIKFIVFHYTGMKNEKEAIRKLTDSYSKVSSHYLIKNNGEVITLVPDLYISWHAGISSWKNYKSINKYSIGIEISNPGHYNKYKKFSKIQIQAILKLSKFLIKKYKIKINFILGHSDIAPYRKKDPGEKFPWFFLSQKGVGSWFITKKKNIQKKKNKNLRDNFFNNLHKIGYRYFNKKRKLSSDLKVIKAFQRRYRQNKVNGLIDQECVQISAILAKN